MPLLSPSPPKTKPRIKNSLSNTLHFLLLPQLSHWKQLHLLFSSLHPINIETPPLFCVLLCLLFLCFFSTSSFFLSLWLLLFIFFFFLLLLLLLLFAKIRPLYFFCVYSVVCFFCFNFVWCVFLLSMMCVYSYLTCPIDLMA